MSQCRRIGTIAEDHECAKDIAAQTYAEVDSMLAEMLSDFNGNVPASVRISDMESAGWHGQEQDFARLIAAGNWVDALSARDAFLSRVRAFSERVKGAV